MNPGTITGQLSWCKQEQKFARDGEESTKEPSQKPKVILRQFIRFWQILRRIGMEHRASTLCRSEADGIAERAFQRVKGGTSAVSLQSGLDDKWLSDSMECNCYLRHVQICDMSKTSWQTGKLLVNEEFGESFKGPILPFGALVEYLPNSERERQSEISSIWKESMSRNLSRMCFDRGKNLERRYSGCIRNSSQNVEYKSSPDNPQRWRICCLL